MTAQLFSDNDFFNALSEIGLSFNKEEQQRIVENNEQEKEEE